ncbi:unnamed protein product [Calypogeia fissa]
MCTVGQWWRCSHIFAINLSQPQVYTECGLQFGGSSLWRKQSSGQPGVEQLAGSGAESLNLCPHLLFASVFPPCNPGIDRLCKLLLASESNSVGGVGISVDGNDWVRLLQLSVLWRLLLLLVSVASAYTAPEGYQ